METRAEELEEWLGQIAGAAAFPADMEHTDSLQPLSLKGAPNKIHRFHLQPSISRDSGVPSPPTLLLTGPSRESANSASHLRENAQMVKELLDFIGDNGTNEAAVERIAGELVRVYQSGGVNRVFALQFLPAVMGAYLGALADRRKSKCGLLETLLLAVYSDEIVDKNLPPDSGERGLEVMKAVGSGRAVEETRVAGLSYASIYHDPHTLAPNALLPNSTLNRLSAPSPSIVVPYASGLG